MKVNEERTGDVVVLRLEGNFFGGAECTAVYSRAKELVAEGITKLVVDLEGVALMNSAGLGAVVGALVSLRNSGGDLRLSNIKGRIEKLFMGADIMGLFQTFDSTEAAVQSFQP
jgi:anti-sigma B factor antagonist